MIFYNFLQLFSGAPAKRAKMDWPSEGAAEEGGVGGIPPRPSVPPERSGGGHSSGFVW